VRSAHQLRQEMFGTSGLFTWRDVERAIEQAQREAIDEAAKVAEAGRDNPKYQEPTDWAYGAQDASVVIADAIRSLLPGDQP
jgi:hypothetical protein